MPREHPAPVCVQPAHPVAMLQRKAAAPAVLRVVPAHFQLPWVAALLAHAALGDCAQWVVVSRQWDQQRKIAHVLHVLSVAHGRVLLTESRAHS